MSPRDSAANNQMVVENNQMAKMNEIERKYQIFLAIKYTGYVKFRETSFRLNTCTKDQLKPQLGS